jgi:ribosome biogenesis GTPase
MVMRASHDQVACKLRGRRLDVVVGDVVELERERSTDEWTVVQRLSRRNVLERTDSRGFTESIASNLDQLGIVLAPRPACDPFVIDRYVAGGLYAGIPSLLIVNKSDLPPEEGDLGYLEPFASAGFPLVRISARTKAGLPELVEALKGKRTFFAGQSGVGKSSLLNALAGTDVRATRTLSEGTGEGRHTTVSSAILRLPWGEIADSPGVRDYAPPVVALQDVQKGFPEICGAAPGCRFLDCLHLREPQCAVSQAAAEGRIDARRYESYRRLVNLTRQLAERRGPGRAG